MSGMYDDIIALPHHVSARHPRMTIAERAAQFSPFAALTGYEAAIHETARLTDRRIELDESEKEILDEKLRDLSERLSDQPEVSITYFRPDGRKMGGAYLIAAGVVKRIDEFKHIIMMKDGRRIPIDEIIEIDSALSSRR